MRRLLWLCAMGAGWPADVHARLADGGVPVRLVAADTFIMIFAVKLPGAGTGGLQEKEFRPSMYTSIQHKKIQIMLFAKRKSAIFLI